MRYFSNTLSIKWARSEFRSVSAFIHHCAATLRASGPARRTALGLAIDVTRTHGDGRPAARVPPAPRPRAGAARRSVYGRNRAYITIADPVFRSLSHRTRSIR
jgi:hypothetical protein